MSEEASAIAELVSFYKKSGRFDAARRDLLRDFEASPAGAALRDRLLQIVEAEVRRDPSLISNDTLSGTGGGGGGGGRAVNRTKAVAAVSQVIERSTLHAELRRSTAKSTFDNAQFREKIAAQVRERHDAVRHAAAATERQAAAVDFMAKMGGV